MLGASDIWKPGRQTHLPVAVLDGRDVGHGGSLAQVEDAELTVVHARAKDVVILCGDQSTCVLRRQRLT